MSKESAYFTLKSIDGKRDLKELKKELNKYPGVISVSVNPVKNTLAVDYDTTGVYQPQIQERIEKLGYEICSSSTETHIM
ncbi:heavy-metal-associated domain-containing protein [Paludicola sp. MB14-C6]|uniref:heavy-metal-associated domain-containing protein n=1 Tax=Paludihabitans sp. MB14-C6 TaxID=3070656 RepID=UPI0027DD2AD2|nr:heavy-metal-associated domain-containing protein [Paludicola sp. MB14-C6]WMJ23312.1 heavy-metal-associated domain-containing protein [Paludicola sp. MB14-C6]